ncbi:MAG: tryptophan--tRNA ligase [Promethearchaeota archaeon]
MSEKQPSIDPWSTKLFGEDDYIKLCEEFGIETIDKLDIPWSIFEKNRFLRRKVIFGHRDLGMILKAIRENKPWAVMSGIKPSGHFHLGTFTTASEIVEFQKMGGTAWYAIADYESFVDNGMPFEESFKNAIDNLADIFAIGLDPERSVVWLQSEESKVKDMPFIAGRYVTNNQMRAIYGEHPFALYIAALVQVGDILMPQLVHGPMPTVVPVGIDQDPHIRLTRDLTRHFSKKDSDPKTGKITESVFFKPGATYHKLLPAINDITLKMSKSLPNSYFNFDDDPKSIKKKIMGAFTGGRRNKEEHQKLGGIPERCMVYKLMEYHFEPSDEALADRYQRCKGGMLCGQCKKEVATRILEYVEDHNEKKKKFIPIAEKMLKELKEAQKSQK